MPFIPFEATAFLFPSDVDEAISKCTDGLLEVNSEDLKLLILRMFM